MSSDVDCAALNADYEYPLIAADELLKRRVWNKGREIPNYNPNVWRIDTCWRLMKYSEHGNVDSYFGWEIDHIFPRAKGGLTEIDNLQPLNWRTNRRKSDTYPYNCQ